MLDDECRMGIRGTDANYASRLYKEHEATDRFEADSAMRTKLCFAVKHYAGQASFLLFLSRFFLSTPLVFGGGGVSFRSVALAFRGADAC